jgi:hypothetical protein
MPSRTPWLVRINVESHFYLCFRRCDMRVLFAFFVIVSVVNCCLLVAFNTVQRQNNMDYMGATVRSVEAALNKRDWNVAFCNHVSLLVMSQSSQHDAFRSITPSDVVATIDNSKNRTIDEHAHDQPPVDDDNNPELRPGERVRQQSIDLISLLDAILPMNFSYFLLTEDDATLCEGALVRIVDDLAFITGYVGLKWSIFRTSVGFIGILLHRESARALRSFLNAYYLIKPPDLLLSEFAHGVWPGSSRNWEDVPLRPMSVTDHRAKQYGRNESEPQMSYFIAKGDLFQHHGIVSSLRSRSSASVKRCHQPIKDVFDPRERYQSQCQTRHFVSPCT